jgi:integrase/recombinase XerD
MNLLQEFIDDCEIRGMTHGTIRSYNSNVGLYLRWLKKEKTEPLKADATVIRNFITYLRKEGKSPKTLENYFAAISSFYEWLLYEDRVSNNPVRAVRKRYLRKYKENGPKHERKLLSVKEMAMLVNSIPSKRDRAIVVLLAKTGIRREELVQIDVDDINWEDESIMLKPHPKRTNRRVYFDAEVAITLKRWLKVREALPDEKALFVGNTGTRLQRNGIYNIVTHWAERVDLHDPKGELEGKFTPHCCRHWFTTHLLRNGMPREMVEELRGDAGKAAIDIYYHIDPRELKKQYRARIPPLGV